jgi:hypothetical protein
LVGVHPTEQVGAVGDVDAGTRGLLQGAESGIEHVVHLLAGPRRQTVLRPVGREAVVGDERRNEPGVVVEEELEAGVVEQVPVLDAPYAVAQAVG